MNGASRDAGSHGSPTSRARSSRTGTILRAVGRSLPLVAALSAGAWKILALRAANLELARRNSACESAFSDVRGAIREARAARLRRGDPAPGFTLPALDGDPVRVQPGSDPGVLHLLFVDPWGLEPEGAPGDLALTGLLESYRRVFAGRDVAARSVVLTPSGPEAARARLVGSTRLAHSASWVAEIAVHAWAAYRAYGVDAPALVVVEGGRVRERWSLPVHGDELPID